jgi:hypothetical protein
MGILRRSYPGVFTGVVGSLALVSQNLFAQVSDAQVVIAFDPISGVPIPRWAMVLTAILLALSAALVLRWRGDDLGRFRSWFIGILSSGVLLSGAFGVNLLEDAHAVISGVSLVTSPTTQTVSSSELTPVYLMGAGLVITFTNKTGVPIIISGRSIGPPGTPLVFYVSAQAPIPECVVGAVLAADESCYVGIRYNGVTFL